MTLTVKPTFPRPLLPTKPHYLRMPGPCQWDRTPGAPTKLSSMPGCARKLNGPADYPEDRR